jgi:hypothetical protein
MPLRRLLRGRVIKRTRRYASNILVTFRSERKGARNHRLLLPLAEYLAEVEITFQPSCPSKPSQSNAPAIVPKRAKPQGN